MKITFKLLLLLPMSLLFIQSSCRKNKEEPKVFTYGPYKFAAKVNGQAFMPDGGILGTPLRVTFLRARDESKTNLYVNAYRTDNHTHVTIFINDVNGPGHYSLNTVTVGYPYDTNPPHYGEFQNDYDWWLTNSIDTGYVDISEFRFTDNVDNHVVKATFYFKARSISDQSVIEVTEGYFSKN